MFHRSSKFSLNMEPPLSPIQLKRKRLSQRKNLARRKKLTLIKFLRRNTSYTDRKRMDNGSQFLKTSGSLSKSSAPKSPTT